MILLLLLLQTDPPALVEQLRSERVEERAAAERRLKELGKDAVPALERAAKDADGELAARARALLALLSLRDRFTSGLLRVMPDLPERILRNEREWVSAFLATTEADENGWIRHPTLRRRDVEVLAGEALARASAPQERAATVLAIASWEIRPLAPALVPRLRDPPPVGVMAANALSTLRAPETIPGLVGLLDHGEGHVRRDAARVLEQLDGRAAALAALAGMGDRDALPAIERLVRDPADSVRARALEALARLRAPSAEGLLLAALDDPEEGVVESAALGLARLGVRRAVPRLEELLLRSKPREGRALYVAALLELGGVEAIRGLAEPHQGFVAVQGRPAFNAVRSSGSWRSLNLKTLPGDLEGPVLPSLEAVAREAGLALEVSAYPSAGYHLDYHRRVPNRGGLASLREALDALLQGSELTYVLEEGRLRVLGRADALDFWKAWWEEFRSRP